MLNSWIITLTIEGKEYDIFVSPFSLHSKEPLPPNKSGKIEILYFYSQLEDDDYKAMLRSEVIDKRFKCDRYIIDYGQDFEKYYLGSLHMDFDAKRYWLWEGTMNTFREQHVKVLAESIFDPGSQLRSVTMFTPTQPSDFKLSKNRTD